MKSTGKWLIFLTVLFAGIIIGSLTRTSPDIAESSVKPFNEIQSMYKEVDLGPAPTAEVNTLKVISQINPHSDSAMIVKQTSPEQKFDDKNKQEAKQIQQIDNNEPEDEKSYLAAQLKLQEKNEIKRLNAELVKLNIYVSEQRKEIENWYASELNRLKLWADTRSKELDEESKLAYARCLQNMNTTVSGSVATISTNTYGHSNTYYSSDGYASTNSYAYTNGEIAGIRVESVIGNPVEDYKLELENIKEGQKAIADVFDELMKTRERCLSELEEYAARKRAVIEAKKLEALKNTNVKLAGGPGLIDAISYSDSKPCIMFSGMILYEGDYANGFKIIKIHQDRVEFEKNSEIFVQRL